MLDMQNLTIYDDLITGSITLKVILEDIDKNSKVIDLEINNIIKQLELLEKELRIMILGQKFLGRPSNSIGEEIDNIEGLKEDVKREVNGAKMLQDLNYKKNDEIVTVSRIELKLKRQGASKKSTDFLKKSIIPKKYLHLVLQARKGKFLFARIYH